MEEQRATVVAGGDIRQKLEFHHTHLELGALAGIRRDGNREQDLLMYLQKGCIMVSGVESIR